MLKSFLWTTLLSLVLLTFCVLSAHAQSSDNVLALAGTFELVAVTGTLIDGYGPVLSLGTGPSINDSGKVAFMAWDTVKAPSTLQNNRVFLENTGTFEINFANTDLQIVGNNLQVNENDQITWQDYTFTDDRTRIRRLDDPIGGIVLGTGSLSDITAPFQLVTEWPWINDSGYGVFGADLHAGGGTVLVLYDEVLGTTTTTTPLSGFPEFFPMISNDNQTVVRGGAPSDSPIVVFTDETLANILTVADMTEFTELGLRPGISDDGRVMVFTGNEIAVGSAGLYAAIIISPTQVARYRLTGLPVGSNVHKRVAVNQSAQGTPNDYQITYHADNAFSQEGLYTLSLNIDDEFSPVIGTSDLVVEVGGTLGIFNETITQIETYDPINNEGQLVFWARSTLGTQAIIKAATESTTGGGFSYGDVNADSGVTSIDASQAARHTVGLITLGFGAQQRADVSGDNNITSIDASQIARFAVGLITCFPAEASCP